MPPTSKLSQEYNADPLALRRRYTRNYLHFEPKEKSDGRLRFFAVQNTQPGTTTSTTSGSSGSATSGKLTGDLAVAALAASLENLAVVAYGDVLSAATAGKLGSVPPAVATFATTVKSQHTQHAQAWNSAIVAAGHQAITTPDPVLTPVITADFAKVTDVTGAAKLALMLEDVAAATYQSAISAVKATSSIKVAASIQPVEMQHAAILNFVLGQYPVPNAFSPVSNARPLTDYAKG